MEVKDFIKAKLEKLSLTFPDIVIKYAYNENAETHIIQLTPAEEYYHNEDLDNHWLDISAEFMWRFPNDNISFISDDSSLRISNPELEFNSFVATYGNGIDWMNLFSNRFIRNNAYAISHFVVPSYLHMNSLSEPMPVFSNLNSMYFHPSHINYVGVDILFSCVDNLNFTFIEPDVVVEKGTTEDSRLKAA